MLLGLMGGEPGACVVEKRLSNCSIQVDFDALVANGSTDVETMETRMNFREPSGDGSALTGDTGAGCRSGRATFRSSSTSCS